MVCGDRRGRGQQLIAGIGREPRIRARRYAEINKMNGSRPGRARHPCPGCRLTSRRIGRRCYSCPSMAILVNAGSKRILILPASPSALPAGNRIPTTSAKPRPAQYAVLERNRRTRSMVLMTRVAGHERIGFGRRRNRCVVASCESNPAGSVPEALAIDARRRLRGRVVRSISAIVSYQAPISALPSLRLGVERRSVDHHQIDDLSRDLAGIEHQLRVRRASTRSAAASR